MCIRDSPNIQVRGNDITSRTYCRFHLQSVPHATRGYTGLAEQHTGVVQQFISSYPNRHPVSHPSVSASLPVTAVVSIPKRPSGPATSAGTRLSRAHTTKAGKDAHRYRQQWRVHFTSQRASAHSGRSKALARRSINNKGTESKREERPRP